MQIRNYSYWEQIAGISSGVRSAVGSRLKERPDVLIVGAGFCGSWLAYFLVRRHPKLKIAIVERDFLNLGASVRNAGFLSCGNVSEWLADAQDFSWEETVRTLQARIEGIQIVKREFANEPSLFNCGSADLDPLTEEKRDLLEKLNAAVASFGIAPFFDTRTIAYGGSQRSVAFNHFDSEVDPCRLLLSLHRELDRAGVQFIWGANVLKLSKGEALVGIGGENETLYYGYAFACTNAFAKSLNGKSSVEPARGQILVTSACKTSTPRCLGFLRSGYDYFRFIGERVLVGGGRLQFKEQENTQVLEVTAGLKEYLRQLATDVIGHSDFTVDYHWSGIMGMRQGKHASITDLRTPLLIDSQTEELAGFGGWGVTLTPYVASERAKEWLSH
jgi:gamma-glutamylputrescine oxidase